MTNQQDWNAAENWYENAFWGNEDFKTAAMRGFVEGLRRQRQQDEQVIALLREIRDYGGTSVSFYINQRIGEILTTLKGEQQCLN